MKNILSLIAIFVFSISIFGQTNYELYTNARFGYSISYPTDLLAPQGEADNGDGQIFKGDAAEMRVYGSNLLLHETLSKEYAAIIQERGAKNVTYKTIGKNFFAVSGRTNGKIFYQKTLRNSQDQFITLMIEYDESQKAVYDKAVAKMVKSFK